MWRVAERGIDGTARRSKPPRSIRMLQPWIATTFRNITTAPPPAPDLPDHQPLIRSEPGTHVRVCGDVLGHPFGDRASITSG